MCGTSSALMRSDDVSMQTSFVRSSVRSLSREQFHEVSYAEWGSSGDLGPVICVHGLTRQGRDFDFLAMKLAERRYKVLCPDVVGRGHSGHLVNPLDYDLQQYVLDMTVLIASLRAEQVDWIGTSLGGMIGILMAGLSNSPINRLVVNDIGPDLPLQAVLRIGKYVRDAPDSFPTTEAAQAYFRNVLSPFGKLEDWQWRHLSDHSIRPNGQGGYRLHYDRRLTLRVSISCHTQPQAMDSLGAHQMPHPHPPRSGLRSAPAANCERDDQEKFARNNCGDSRLRACAPSA